MENKTLGQQFAEIRAKLGVPMLDISIACNLSEAAVWKLEHDCPVRWETVHLILAVALEIDPESKIYKTMNQLWLKQRQERAMARTPDAGISMLSKHAVEATRKFRNLVRDLSPADARKVLAGAAAVNLHPKPDA